jgi:hypothetical protein
MWLEVILKEIKKNHLEPLEKGQINPDPNKAISPVKDADGQEKDAEKEEGDKEGGEEEEAPKPPRTKNVLKKILRTYLFMNLGTYPPDISTKLSMYFLRTTPGTVVLPNSLDEANQTLNLYFDFGLLNSHPLFMLSQMLTKVYFLKF